MAEDDGLEEVKLAIVKLTTIVGTQSKQLDNQAEHGAILMVMAEGVKTHGEQILDLYEKHNDTKDKLTKEITEARASLNRASYGRLIFAISVASGLTWQLWGINHADITRILATKDMVLSRLTAVEGKVTIHHEGNKNEKIKFDSDYDVTSRRMFYDWSR